MYIYAYVYVLINECMYVTQPTQLPLLIIIINTGHLIFEALMAVTVKTTVSEMRHSEAR